MDAYSKDLRLRAIGAYDGGVSSAEVAADLGVSSSWVRKMRLRLVGLGHVDPTPHPGCTPKIPESMYGVLTAVATKLSDATLSELSDAFFEETGIRVHPSTVGRNLRAAGMTRKKRPSGPRSVSPTE